MELTVIRRTYSTACTIGELYIDRNFFCYTLEDVVRAPGQPKIPGKTAIPAGRYQLIINTSPRFVRRLPLLLQVPGFEGVRIHNGNHAGHTEGCILVGYQKGPNMIYRSRVATRDLIEKLEAVLAAKETVYVSVQDTKLFAPTAPMQAGRIA